MKFSGRSLLTDLLPSPEALVGNGDNSVVSTNIIPDYYTDYKRPSSGLGASGSAAYNVHSRSSSYGSHGGCCCCDSKGSGGSGMAGLLGGLGGDAGLLAAGAAAVFLLYTAITMMARRKKREDHQASIFANGNYGAVVEDFLWTGRTFPFLILNLIYTKKQWQNTTIMTCWQPEVDPAMAVTVLRTMSKLLVLVI